MISAPKKQKVNDDVLTTIRSTIEQPAFGQLSFQLPEDPEKVFDTSNGPISRYQILVVAGAQSSGETGKADG